MKEQDLCGEEKEIFYDTKVKKLNLELCIDKLGTPIIRFQDWTGKKNKSLFQLHLKEAIELKSIIDNLFFDYVEREK